MQANRPNTEIHEEYTLIQNQLNPFNPKTTLKFTILKSEFS